MKTIALRDFQREGTKTLQAMKILDGSGASQPLLLTGRDQDYLLFPVPEEDRAAMMDLAEGLAAVLSLRQGHRQAAAAGLDSMSPEEIESEIRSARKTLKRKLKSA